MAWIEQRYDRIGEEQGDTHPQPRFGWELDDVTGEVRGIYGLNPHPWDDCYVEATINGVTRRLDLPPGTERFTVRFPVNRRGFAVRDDRRPDHWLVPFETVVTHRAYGRPRRSSPVVLSTTTTAFNTMSTTHNTSLGATINAGDGLFVVFGGSANAGHTANSSSMSGFTEVLDAADAQWFETTDFRQFVAAYLKEATGSEDGTSVSVTTSVACSGSSQVFRLEAGSYDTIEVSADAQGEGTSWDSPAITPSWGGSDTMFMVAVCGDNDGLAVSAPSGYASGTNTDGNSTEDVTLYTARRVASTGTENPAAATYDDEKWVAVTFAIAPAADEAITGTGAMTQAAQTMAGSGTHTAFLRRARGSNRMVLDGSGHVISEASNSLALSDDLQLMAEVYGLDFSGDECLVQLRDDTGGVRYCSLMVRGTTLTYTFDRGSGDVVTDAPIPIPLGSVVFSAYHDVSSGQIFFAAGTSVSTLISLGAPLAGTTGAVFAGTEDVVARVGTRVDGFGTSGDVIFAGVINGVGSVLVANFEAQFMTVGEDAGDTIVDSEGILWTLAGTAVIEGPENDPNTMSGAGKVGVQGTGAMDQADQTMAGAGQVGVTGTGEMLQADDVMDGAGTFETANITGTGAMVQDDQTMEGGGTVINHFTGSGAMVQEDDTMAGEGGFGTVGSGHPVQADDTMTGSGTVAEPPLLGAGAMLQQSQMMVSAGIAYATPAPGGRVGAEDGTPGVSGAPPHPASVSSGDDSTPGVGGGQGLPTVGGGQRPPSVGTE